MSSDDSELDEQTDGFVDRGDQEPILLGQRSSPNPRHANEITRRAKGYGWWKPEGMCMQFSWTCVDGEHRYGLADANAGWARSKMRRTDRTPPAGAIVYWGGGQHGHVAISLGGGRVQSTDWPRKTNVGAVSIDTISRSWGITYRGYALDIAGYGIPGLAPDSGSGDRNPNPGEDDDDVQQADIDKIVKAVVAQLRPDINETHARVMGMLRQRYYLTDAAGNARNAKRTDAGALPGRALDTLDGNTLLRHIKQIQATLDKQ